MATEQKPKRVAIIGSGAAGMGAAWLLTEHSPHIVTLYEANDYLGGHTHTVDYVVPSTKDSDKPLTIPVDTGFIVFNQVTYPNLIRFFDHMKIKYIPSEMSFSVSRNKGEFEWSGRNLLSVFAQPQNLLNWDMWKTLYDIFRFNFHATELLELPDDHPEKSMSLGEYLDLHKYSHAFRDNYLLPMTASIWSTPLDKCSAKFPALTLIQFMHNHSLLQILDRIRWLTVKDGSRKYVEAIASKLNDIRVSTRVLSITRVSDSSLSAPEIVITDNQGGHDKYDHVIFATHADQALEILGDSATTDEKNILKSFQFNKNRAYLHNDLSLMPQRRLTFSSWNYITKSTNSSRNPNQVSLTYSMNILQSIDESKYGPVLVSLNPLYEPDPTKVFGSWEYDHPVYTSNAVSSQQALANIQNLPHLQTTFSGAWTKYGFHEDGFTSGMKIAAEFLGANPPFEIKDATYIRGKKLELTLFGKAQRQTWLTIEWAVSLMIYLYTYVITVLDAMADRVRQLLDDIEQRRKDE
ncbi:5296_t:CDS:2 [Ambispora gerdemannii]|uniref:5296_t:CDS:1 n=1 Tax=Ambispora gerdemannii TaxID=144530 RepID=A0A9N8V013_9GLOM|nr:5296_t:CDS:2 [Ambispora gerdemannii]